jgi:hypothetical protein
VVAAALLAACSLLVGTEGYSTGRDAGAEVEAGAGDASAGADAGDGADAAVLDAAVRCSAQTLFSAPVKVESLATAADEEGISLMPDELTAYISRSIDGGYDGDIFVTTRATRSDPFGAVLPLALDTTDDEANPAVSADGLTLFFHGHRATGYQIFVASRASLSAPFGDVAQVAALGAAEDVDPSVTEHAVYFATVQSGNDFDLARAPRSGTAVLAPQILTEVSSTSNDVGPVATADELTLYFASERPGGIGGYDVYVAERATATDPFGTPRLVQELNSTAYDVPRWLSPDGCTLYLMSSRSGTSGKNDIYVARRAP